MKGSVFIFAFFGGKKLGIQWIFRVIIMFDYFEYVFLNNMCFKLIFGNKSIVERYLLSKILEL